MIEPNITQRIDKDIVKRESPEIFSQEIIGIEEPLLDKTEPLKAEIKLSEETETSITDATKTEHSASKALEIDFHVHESGEILAAVEDKVSEGLIPKKEEQKQILDRIAAAQEAEARVGTAEC